MTWWRTWRGTSCSVVTACHVTRMDHVLYGLPLVYATLPSCTVDQQVQQLLTSCRWDQHFNQCVLTIMDLFM